MVRLTNIKMPPQSNEEDLREYVIKRTGIKSDELNIRIIRKSIDARDKGKISVVYTLDAGINLLPLDPIIFPRASSIPSKPPVIIGSGPSGLIMGLMLSMAGMKPIIIERGDDVDNRKIKVNRMLDLGELDIDSNIQFGEGGAGTFSDGKLNTLLNSPYNHTVLRLLNECGAPEEILYLNKPHIGTDNLINVIKNLRKRIIDNGGKVMFNTLGKDIIIKDGRVQGVVIRNMGNESIIDTDIVILAVGHSARDTFYMLYDKGVAIEQKEFACGMRIEHPAELINESQYGKFKDILPPADYKLVSHTPYRSVYTFCMCPGGYVMPASSEFGRLTINGMSYYKRDGINSNSALLINVTKADFISEHPLSGIEYQRELETRAYEMGGGGYCAPAQSLYGFMKGKLGAIGSVQPSYKPKTKVSPLYDFFDENIYSSYKYAITDMARRLKGFDSCEAVLTAVESRSSSPVRVVRGKDYQSINVKGVYPIGEGCGYAGGIMSAAIDGLKAALYIIGPFS